jgi:uncharacterized protein (DUF2336 family)
MSTENPMPTDLPLLSYEEARDLASSDDWRRRRDLADRRDIPPEVLYFLASDGVAEVRAAVAGNPAAPAKGNLVLADDPEETVRRALAGKIAYFGGRVGISDDQARARETMDDVVARLAADAVIAIRAAISQGLKGDAEADRAVVRRLAADRNIVVAAPVLEWSPLLDDDDLLELISGDPGPGVLAAIARRPFVGTAVTSAIVAAGEAPAITHLLRNAHASLQEETLDILIEGASSEPTWQEPLVVRPELNEKALDRVVDMTALSVLDRILERRDLPVQTAQAVTRAIGESVRARQRDPGKGKKRGGATAVRTEDESLLERARIHRQNGELDEMALMVALLTDQDEEVLAGLSVLAGIGLSGVRDILGSGSARTICSLAWAAGLSAAFAAELQLRQGNLPADAVITPDSDEGFVLGEDEMAWQMDMFRAAGLI